MNKKARNTTVRILASFSLCLGMISPICAAAERIPDTECLESNPICEYEGISVSSERSFIYANPAITSGWTSEDWYYLGKMTSAERAGYLSYLDNEHEISELVKKYAADSDGYMAGFENRCKTPHSLYNKMHMRPEKMSIYEVDDVLRYTLILHEDSYASTAKETIGAFLENGWHINYLWNAWLETSLPYQGINVSLFNDDGLIIEMQFHTEKSFEVKNSKEDHDLYEKRRLLEAGSEEYNQILEQQKELYRDIIVPAGVNTVVEGYFCDMAVAC